MLPLRPNHETRGLSGRYSGDLPCQMTVNLGQQSQKCLSRPLCGKKDNAPLCFTSLLEPQNVAVFITITFPHLVQVHRTHVPIWIWKFQLKGHIVPVFPTFFW